MPEKYNLESKGSTLALSIKRIQKYLNSNENYFKINPIFSNKQSRSPVVSKAVQGCNQIDLVDMRSMSITKGGVE